MEETLTLLRETARVAAGEGGEAARLAAGGDGARDCAVILDEACRRLSALSAEPPRQERAPEREGGSPERAIRCAAVGAIALGSALERCPDADADARGLASRLLVLLRGLLDSARGQYAVREQGIGSRE